MNKNQDNESCDCQAVTGYVLALREAAIVLTTEARKNELEADELADVVSKMFNTRADAVEANPAILAETDPNPTDLADILSKALGIEVVMLRLN